MTHAWHPTARAWALALSLLAASSLLAGATAAPAAAVTPAAAAPAVAATSQFRGVNWPDTRDNYNTGWVIPDGLSASDSYATVYSIANSYLLAFQKNLAANTVRLPINEPSVSQSWWARYRGAIDAALHDKMKVILSYWSQKTTVGTITSMSAWNTMWNTVVSDYGSNPNVYFEPMNEPYGYTLSQWVSICTGWLKAHSGIPRGRVIISGTGYNAYLSGVGAASALNGTLLSLHFYPGWANYTQESQWQADIKGRLGGYGGRAVIDEFGAPMTTGINYLANHNGAHNQSYFAAVTDLARSDHIGSVYWAGLKTGDNFSMEAHHGATLTDNNSSGAEQLRWGFGV
jgi:Cellulase (glycosyl hydrolase family 5)